MPVTQYIGSRYVPIFADPAEWSSTKTYEPLTIVLHQGNSFTSKQFVPIGVDITNTDFWAETGSYNAQVEQYRGETLRYSQVVEQVQAILPTSEFDDTNTVKAYVDAHDCYVYVRDYGAKGDGLTDDTNAIQSAINAAASSDAKKIVVFDNLIYKTDRLVVNTSHLSLIGNGCTIKHAHATGFYVSSASHDISFKGFNFVGSFEPNDTDTPSNSGIGIAGQSNTALYEAYNIRVTDCSFVCGVFGISATNVKNLYIANCYFTGAVYRPELQAGGYAILEQSCVNVTIERCFFSLGNYGRHDIYVSVMQSKTDNIGSKNVKIFNCVSDRTNMAPQPDGGYFSIGTDRIAIRACTNLHVDGFYAIGGTGIIAIGNDDGPQQNAVIENLYLTRAKYFTSSEAPAESRFAIRVLGYQNADNYIEVRINNLVVEDCDENFGDLSGEADLLIYENSIVNYLLIISETVKKTYLVLNNLGLKASGALRYSGTNILNGRFSNLYNASDRTTLSAGSTTAGGKISLSCYELEAKIFEISASDTIVWKNNNLVHPITGAIDLSDNSFRKVPLTYTTKPSGGLFVPYGAGTIGFFDFDVTHDLTESSFRLYSYGIDGAVDRTKRGYVMMF